MRDGVMRCPVCRERMT